MAIVPPGGFAGFSQMTPATKARFGQAFSSRGTGSRRRRKAKRAKRASRSTRRSSSKRRSSGRKMKFGSPAWQKKYKVGKFRK